MIIEECKEAIQSVHRFIKEIEPKEYHTYYCSIFYKLDYTLIFLTSLALC